jgi:hypothetical protein
VLHRPSLFLYKRNNGNDMKKWHKTLLVAAAILAVGVAVWRYTAPQRHVSDLYRRYHNADGIAASYIHNFPVNDTLTLDVTLLEATTDSAWQALCADFALSDIVEEMKKVALSAVFSRQVNRRDYTQVVIGDSPDAECLSISCDSRTIAVFHTRNAAEMKAVLHHNLTN